jgi:hypothetical protein
MSQDGMAINFAFENIHRNKASSCAEQSVTKI